MKKRCTRVSRREDTYGFYEPHFPEYRYMEALEYLVLAGVIDNKTDEKHLRNFLRIFFNVDEENIEDPRPKKRHNSQNDAQNASK